MPDPITTALAEHFAEFLVSAAVDKGKRVLVERHRARVEEDFRVLLEQIYVLMFLQRGNLTQAQRHEQVERLLEEASVDADDLLLSGFERMVRCISSSAKVYVAKLSAMYAVDRRRVDGFYRRVGRVLLDSDEADVVALEALAEQLTVAASPARLLAAIETRIATTEKQLAEARTLLDSAERQLAQQLKVEPSPMDGEQHAAVLALLLNSTAAPQARVGEAEASLRELTDAQSKIVTIADDPRRKYGDGFVIALQGPNAAQISMRAVCYEERARCVTRPPSFTATVAHDALDDALRLLEASRLVELDLTVWDERARTPYGVQRPMPQTEELVIDADVAAGLIQLFGRVDR